MPNTNQSNTCDEIIFSSFFKSHFNALQNFLFCKFGNKDQTENVAQEAFIKKFYLKLFKILLIPPKIKWIIYIS